MAQNQPTAIEDLVFWALLGTGITAFIKIVFNRHINRYSAAYDPIHDAFSQVFYVLVAAATIAVSAALNKPMLAVVGFVMIGLMVIYAAFVSRKPEDGEAGACPEQ